MTLNQWIPNPGTGDNPVREGETLVALRFADGSVCRNLKLARFRDWTHKASSPITHFKVTPPRVAEPATMSADEVLIRAREAVIEAFKGDGADAARARRGDLDDYIVIEAILVYERARAKPLVEVAPHTAEDPDERAAYDVCKEEGALFAWDERHESPMCCAILKAIKRGRELERGA